MFSDSWWQRLFKKIPQSPVRRKRSGASTRLMEVEFLEDRLVPSTFTPNTTSDPDISVSHHVNLGNGHIFTNVGSGVDTGVVSLRSAVFAANNNGNDPTVDVIKLGNSTYTLTQGQIALTSNMTIMNTAGGTHFSTIDANHNSRIFEVDDTTVLLDHLILKNGQAPADSSTAAKGGAIIEHLANLTLNYDQFLNNNATGFTGTLVDSEEFFTPTAAYGGAIYVDSSLTFGPVHTADSIAVTSLTIKNSTFDGNKATGGTGASNNSTTVDGAGAEGGAVYIQTGTGSITASTFSNNVARGGNSADYGGFGGYARGGALVAGSYSSSLNLNIVNSTFAGNSAYGGQGHSNGSDTNDEPGAAFGGAIHLNTGPTVNLVNDTIALNQVFGAEGASPGHGGGVSNLWSFGTTINVVNTIIARNQTTSSDPLTGTYADDVLGDFNSLGHNLIDNTDNSSGFTAAGDLTGPFSPASLGLDTTLRANGANSAVPNTLALLATSKAINTADNGVTTGTLADSTTLASLGITKLITDERGTGFARKVVTTVDIGAYEFQLNYSPFYQFRSSNSTSVTFTVPGPKYFAGLLAGAGTIGLLPGQHYEVVPLTMSFQPGTSLTVNKDGSFSFTVPKKYVNTVYFPFRLRVVGLPAGVLSASVEGVSSTIPTNLVFYAGIQVLPPKGGRGSAGSYLP
jgi:hypothetical protein